MLWEPAETSLAPHNCGRHISHTALTSDVDLQTARSDKDAESSASAAIAG